MNAGVRSLVFIVVALITSLITVQAVAEMPVIPKGKGEFCVAPTEVMRKDHMKFLLHQRDKTVQQGIRTKKFSLTQCVDCHVQSDSSGAHIPVNQPGQFCQVCHGFASVKMDCFECHATKPDQPGVHAAITPGRDHQINPVNATAFSAHKIFEQ